MKKGLFGTLLVLTITAPVLNAAPLMAAKVDASGHRALTATVSKVASGLVSVRTEEGTNRYFTLKEAERNGLTSIEKGDPIFLQMDEGNQIIDIHRSEPTPFIAAPGQREVLATVKKINGVLVSVKTEVGTTRYFTVKKAEQKGIQTINPGDSMLLVIDAGNQIVDIEGPQRHRSVTANVEHYRRSDKMMTVRMEDGSSERYELKEPAVPKLAAVKEGRRITFEIDEQNRVIDLHPSEG
jgi:hypothetical protein